MEILTVFMENLHVSENCLGRNLQVCMETLHISMEDLHVSVENLRVSMETLHVFMETLHVFMEILPVSLETPHVSMELCLLNTTVCITDTDCRADECCYIKLEFIVVSRRQLVLPNQPPAVVERTSMSVGSGFKSSRDNRDG